MVDDHDTRAREHAIATMKPMSVCVRHGLSWVLALLRLLRLDVILGSGLRWLRCFSAELSHSFPERSTELANSRTAEEQCEDHKDQQKLLRPQASKHLVPPSIPVRRRDFSGLVPQGLASWKFSRLLAHSDGWF